MPHLSRPGLCAIIKSMQRNELKKEDPIAIMDSGLGGISVLREMQRVMPQERYIYFGDSRNAPYGEKAPEQILRMCRDNLEMFLSLGAKCVVIACNTATSAAAEDLRKEYPWLPIIGMEPAVKPAASCGPHPRVLVLATPVTIHGDRLHHLVERFDENAEFILLEAPGIVRLVERGICDAAPGPELTAYLQELLQDYAASGKEQRPVDAVVLGCTHFPFVKDSIRKALGYPVQIFDGACGTALQTRHVLAERGLLWDAPEEGRDRQQVLLLNSDPDKLPTERMLLGL